MGYGSEYDRSRGQGNDHSTARARAQQEQAQRDAEARARHERERLRAAEAARAAGSRPSQPFSQGWGSPRTPRLGTAAEGAISPPPPPLPPVAYPTEPAHPGGRHPEIYGLLTGSRPHPFTGEPVLEIEWHNRLPQAREFIPVSAMKRSWRTVQSQGIDLPMQVQRSGDRVLLRWLAPSAPLPPEVDGRTGKGMKVMTGLPGADRKPTFRLR